MAMSIEDKAVTRAYMLRKFTTVPFLVCMLLSLLMLFTYSFQWVRGQMLWHKTDASITLITDTDGLFYEYTEQKTDTVYKSTMSQPKLFYYFPIGKSYTIGDSIPISYNVDQPAQRVEFPRLESLMMTWGIAFVVFFILYFWLEWMIKKHSKIKISG